MSYGTTQNYSPFETFPSKVESEVKKQECTNKSLGVIGIFFLIVGIFLFFSILSWYAGSSGASWNSSYGDNCAATANIGSYNPNDGSSAGFINSSYKPDSDSVNPEGVMSDCKKERSGNEDYTCMQRNRLLAPAGASRVKPLGYTNSDEGCGVCLPMSVPGGGSVSTVDAIATSQAYMNEGRAYYEGNKLNQRLGGLFNGRSKNAAAANKVLAQKQANKHTMKFQGKMPTCVQKYLDCESAKGINGKLEFNEGYAGLAGPNAVAMMNGACGTEYISAANVGSQALMEVGNSLYEVSDANPGNSVLAANAALHQAYENYEGGAVGGLSYRTVADANGNLYTQAGSGTSAAGFISGVYGPSQNNLNPKTGQGKFLKNYIQYGGQVEDCTPEQRAANLMPVSPAAGGQWANYFDQAKNPIFGLNADIQGSPLNGKKKMSNLNISNDNSTAKEMASAKNKRLFVNSVDKLSEAYEGNNNAGWLTTKCPTDYQPRYIPTGQAGRRQTGVDLLIRDNNIFCNTTPPKCLQN